MYLIPIIIVVIGLVWLLYRKQLQNLVRPQKDFVQFSGAPQYIAGSTSGSPLSELGSYCGFKAVPEQKKAGCTALFATVTSFGAGRLYDFAVRLKAADGSKYFRHCRSRKVHFLPYCIEEEAADGDIRMKSRLYFLQKNLALFETEWETEGEPLLVEPEFRLLPTAGRDLENPYPHFNGFTFFREQEGGLLLKNYHRYPGQKLLVFFLPTTGGSKGSKKMRAPAAELKVEQKISWSVIISFSADGEERIYRRAQRALRNLEGLKKAAEKRWAAFAAKLPQPYDDGQPAAEKTLTLAAWALQNSLYQPRKEMTRWGSVPAKVYFPFIWGWDTPQHVLGLSEWNPRRAGEVILTQLESNKRSPREARFKIRAKGITILAGSQSNMIPSKMDDSLRGVLDFYSQPPLQSWAAVRVYERLEEKEARAKFLKQVLPPLWENLSWWEENRRLPNGFFSFLNGLESGLDDSPRFYPPSFLPSFVIGLVPRFFSAVDLNCWLYQSYMNIAYLSSEAGQDVDAANCLVAAKRLREMIDRDLWSESHSAWLDRRNGKFIEVLTPSTWWPAFVGASEDLGKIRAVIERNLLNPDKFWGLYGMPSVAFDDAAYNRRKDGYYWRGQIWMINNYAALEVLFRFGYYAEAAELHSRVIETLYRSAGLYETYNAESGAIGWSSRGPGDPAVMQFGMSSAWATQILFYRYQHFCYIFPETKMISGYLQWATTFDQVPVLSPPSVEAAPREAILQVRVPGAHAYDLPKMTLESGDGRPLLQSALLKLYFEESSRFASSGNLVDFSWRGENYQLHMGKSYLLKPFARSEKLGSA